jgi:hypothetical protein
MSVASKKTSTPSKDPKPAPDTVTDDPGGPWSVDRVTVGGGTTVKELELVAVPPPVVTEIGPVVAPDGTCAVIFLPVLITKVGSGVALKVTAVVVPKAVPRMITRVPTFPELGLNPVMVGGATALAGEATDRTMATASMTIGTECESGRRDTAIPPFAHET